MAATRRDYFVLLSVLLPVLLGAFLCSNPHKVMLGEVGGDVLATEDSSKKDGDDPGKKDAGGTPPVPLRELTLLGKIQALDKPPAGTDAATFVADGFQFLANKGQQKKWHVTGRTTAPCKVAKVVKLPSLEDGTMINILAKATNTGTPNNPEPGYVRIQSIIVCKNFGQTAIPEELRAQDMKWYSGSLAKRKGRQYIGGKPMICDSQRDVLAVMDAEPSDCKKGAVCRIEGGADDASLEIHAKALTVVDASALASPELKYLIRDE